MSSRPLPPVFHLWQWNWRILFLQLEHHHRPRHSHHRLSSCLVLLTQRREPNVSRRFYNFCFSPLCWSLCFGESLLTSSLPNLEFGEVLSFSHLQVAISCGVWNSPHYFESDFRERVRERLTLCSDSFRVCSYYVACAVASSYISSK